MAKAIKCDRCGKYFDRHNGKHRIEGNDITGIAMVESSMMINLMYCQKYDLCDDCIDALQKFMGVESFDCINN